MNRFDVFRVFSPLLIAVLMFSLVFSSRDGGGLVDRRAWRAAAVFSSTATWMDSQLHQEQVCSSFLSFEPGSGQVLQVQRDEAQQDEQRCGDETGSFFILFHCLSCFSCLVVPRDARSSGPWDFEDDDRRALGEGPTRLFIVD